jgi:hypothetical protein
VSFLLISVMFQNRGGMSSTGSADSGNTTSQNTYNYTITKAGANTIQVKCSVVDASGVKNLKVNCSSPSNIGSNSGTIKMSVNNNVECVSGSATITASLDDGVTGALGKPENSWLYGRVMGKFPYNSSGTIVNPMPAGGLSNHPILLQCSPNIKINS